ncbi:MAG: aromatic amino acid transaminase [Pseudomonadota bacterium]
MTTSIAKLTKLPPDPLLGLMAAFREDERTGKVDLGVGVFKTASGETPILKSVKLGEADLYEAEISKVYEGPQGNPGFGPAIAHLALGDDNPALESGRVTAFAAPGGCGSLGLALGFVRKFNPEASVWLSAPSWPNHAHICNQMGLTSAAYPYTGDGEGGVVTAPIIEALKSAAIGDAVLLQGPCHNPTGIDFSDNQWEAIADICAERSLFPIIDIAYHGFAKGLDTDLDGVRTFLAKLPEAIVSYSCSKNFGLYRERAGALLVQAADAEQADVARTHIASIARATYSMPPAHGAGIVATILADPKLTEMWRGEVDEMRGRLVSLRTGFADALRAIGHASVAKALTDQNGMFSILPIIDGGATQLRENFGIYMPGSGRINIAGLPEDRLDEVASRMATILR